MGFRDEVENIMKYLPKNRQTLLFSATVPPTVKLVVKQTLKKDFVTVDCIRDADPATHTNAQVLQRHVIVPSESRMVCAAIDVIVKLVADAKAKKEPLKLVVFLNTAHLVSFYVRVLQMLRVDAKLSELHSKKTQGFRTRVSDQFRSATDGILITTDVSARGVDYPGVTNVVQVGIADSRESYIHRLGRTGRAGKMGEGLLVLTDVERRFLDSLEGLDIPVHSEFQAIMKQPTTIKSLPTVLADSEVQSLMASAYRSLLGFYNGKLQKIGVEGIDRLVAFANNFAYQAGAKELPKFDRQTLAKMGLGRARGLNISDTSERRSGGGGGGMNRFGGSGVIDQFGSDFDGGSDRFGLSNRSSGKWLKGGGRGRNDEIISEGEESDDDNWGGGRGGGGSRGGGSRGGGSDRPRRSSRW
jgi:ATP-dependent RNA helicase MSS116, mitochondrial